MKLFFIAISFLVSSFSFASNCELENESMLEQRECVFQELENTEVKMQLALRTAVLKTPQNQQSAFALKLQESQKTWTQFREKNCQLLSIEWSGGNGQARQILECKTKMTVDRTEEILKRFVF